MQGFNVILLTSAPGSVAPGIASHPVETVDAFLALTAIIDGERARVDGMIPRDVAVAIALPDDPEDGVGQFGLRAAGIFSAMQASGMRGPAATSE